MRHRLRVFMASGAFAAAMLLAGCAPSIAERSYPGLPTGSPPLVPSTAEPGEIALPDADLGPRVQWADGGRLLAVSLWGSSSCRAEPTGLTQVGRDQLTIEITKRSGFLGNCTADLAVATYEILVPDTCKCPTRGLISGLVAHRGRAQHATQALSSGKQESPGRIRSSGDFSSGCSGRSRV